MELKEKITAWAIPFLAEQNLFLTDIKVLNGGKKIEVFADGDNGITIDQCTKLSRLINLQLEELGLNPDLDVSSPGISNPLKVPRQYKRRIGETLEVVKTDGTVIEAVLECADDEKIILKSEPKKPAKKPKKGEEKQEEEPTIYEVKYSEIKKALLQIKW